MIRHYAMLQRNLIYSGVTRGRKLVVLVGQRQAVTIAAKNVSGGSAGRNWTSGWDERGRQSNLQRTRSQASILGAI